MGLLSFAAPPLRRTGPIEPETLTRFINGLGIAKEAFVDANWVDNGAGWPALLLRSRRDVLSVRPDYAILAGARVGIAGPWHPGEDGTDAKFEVRAFTPGGYEDPVTGSLNAGLAQWLVGAAIAPTSYVASQGTVLGRKGRVHVRQDATGLWIGGAVASCITGIANLP